MAWGLRQGDSASATVHPLPHLAPVSLPPRASRYAPESRGLDAWLSGQDEEDRPVAAVTSTAVSAGGGSRARARWLLACTLGRNPATAAYRHGGGPGDAGAARLGQPPAADFAAKQECVGSVVVEPPAGSNSPWTEGVPALRATAQAAIRV